MWWSPSSTTLTTLHSQYAGASLVTGAPVEPALKLTGPSLLPSGRTVAKNAWATSFWSSASTLSAKLPAAFTTAYGWLSCLIATATNGGLNEVWVTQFTVPEATSSPFLAVSKNSPYGILRSAFFLACSSISPSLAGDYAGTDHVTTRGEGARGRGKVAKMAKMAKVAKISGAGRTGQL